MERHVPQRSTCASFMAGAMTCARPLAGGYVVLLPSPEVTTHAASHAIAASGFIWTLLIDELRGRHAGHGLLHHLNTRHLPWRRLAERQYLRGHLVHLHLRRRHLLRRLVQLQLHLDIA